MISKIIIDILCILTGVACMVLLGFRLKSLFKAILEFDVKKDKTFNSLFITSCFTAAISGLTIGMGILQLINHLS